MSGENNILDSIMEAIMNGILSVLEVIFSFVFYSNWTALIFWIIVINIIAIILMKKDKRIC